MREGKCLGVWEQVCHLIAVTKYTDACDVPHAEQKLRQSVILTKSMILSRCGWSYPCCSLPIPFTGHQ